MAAKKLTQIEAVRGLAGSYVALTHAAAAMPLLAMLGPIARFGQEAVMAFFLISGFVISHATETKAPISFGEYLRRRAVRIYPIALLGMGLALIMLPRDPAANWPTFLGNVAMLQDCCQKPGLWFNPFGGDAPLWSLSYEWWFYLLFFAIWRFVPMSGQRALVTALSVSAAVIYQFAPAEPWLILSYFGIWWTGVELARSYAAGERAPSAMAWLPISLVAVVFAVPVGRSILSHQHLSLGFYPLLQLRHVLSALLIAGLGLLWRRLKWRGFRFTIGPFIVLAPISYAIYAIHYPIVTSPLLIFLGPIGRLVVTALLTWVIASFAEGPFQKLANRISLMRPQQARSAAPAA